MYNQMLWYNCRLCMMKAVFVKELSPATTTNHVWFKEDDEENVVQAGLVMEILQGLRPQIAVQVLKKRINLL